MTDISVLPFNDINDAACWSSLYLHLIHQSGSWILGNDSGLMQIKPSSSPTCTHDDRYDICARLDNKALSVW